MSLGGCYAGQVSPTHHSPAPALVLVPVLAPVLVFVLVFDLVLVFEPSHDCSDYLEEKGQGDWTKVKRRDGDRQRRW